MTANLKEKLLSTILAIGAGFTTIIVVSGAVTDPVNAPKLLSLGIVSSLAVGVMVSSGFANFLTESKFLVTALGLFLLASLFSFFGSESPATQFLYGSYGRNNGWLTYFFLVLILASTSSLRSSQSIKKIINGLLFAGAVNVVYSLWVLTFGDFIGWNNVYGEILGTLGNPNFIGAFLGIFITAYFGMLFVPQAPRWFRLASLAVLPITAYEIFISKAIQGRVVGAAGIAIIAFFYIRAKFKPISLVAYSGFSAVAGILALLGTFQIGPLTEFIYKGSVSLRGQYWLAAWNTGEANPLNGVGMDAFGNWYRRSRDAHALEVPGVNTVVDAAHNVPLDMFAFGGWPLFLTYLLIMGIGAWALIRTALRSKAFDSILAVLSATWFGYQLQSIISINQIGLAIWGWVLTGAAISYERITRTAENTNIPNGRKTRSAKNTSSEQAQATIFAAIFGLIGLLIAIPPFSADSKWRSAQVSQNLPQLEGSMLPSYFNPPNSMKYMTNIQILEQSNLPDLSRKYALEAVEWNSESFELWKLLYLLGNSTAEEKALALENMNRLDPLNPDVTATQ
ncbi:hypothetical protein MCEIIB161_00044 [Candidatus Planktophila dulcis]|uniref:O-antigen ligase family protein n=1 Tax=Candidatus Planktophila dulcis TaxID=1884914 RepID=UPI003CF87641